MIGFDTPSKRVAESKEQEKSQQNNPQAISGGTGMDRNRLRAETIQRLNNLGSVICSNDFQRYAPEQRQQILMDFAYFSKVADSVL